MSLNGWSRFAWLSVFLGVGCQADAVPGTRADAAPATVAEITNGENAGSCQWPSTVALLDGGGTPFCSGTLIHPRFVLTAAHCITIGQVPTWMGFGEDAFVPERTVNVSDCTVHPEYGEGVDVDLAVCELGEAVTDVQPVPILMGCELDVLEPGAEISIAGFGNTQSTFIGEDFVDGVGLGRKRHVRQSVAQIREEAEEIDFQGIDAMSGGCHGDSGGGAFVQLSDGTWRVFAVAQSLWNVPGWGSDSSGGTTEGGSTTDATNGFIDPSTDGGGFIDPPGGTENGPQEVCGFGTTYSLVAPRIAWVEDEVSDDVTPCFTVDGEWDGGPACTPFPTQLHEATGTRAKGCASDLGGEPQCGELRPGTGTTGDPTTGDPTSGPMPTTSDTPDTGSTSDDTGEPTTSGTTAASTTLGTAGGTEPGETSDTAGAVGDDDKGCGCRQRSPASPVQLTFLSLLVIGMRRRRAISRKA